jgi:membrane protein DedA with SNARE-associated domain
MSNVVTIVLWFAICIYASFVVAHRIESRRDRIAYYVLIWLIPVIGAAAAILLTRRPKPHTPSSEKMHEAIVDAHRQKDSA